MTSGFSRSDFETARANLFSSQTNLMFSEDRESILEKELKLKISGYKKMEDALNAASMDNSNVLPLQINHYKGQSDTEEKNQISLYWSPISNRSFQQASCFFSSDAQDNHASWTRLHRRSAQRI